MSTLKLEDSSRLFFTSDHHFGHKNICQYSNRPFESLEQMDEQLIGNWNSVVPVNGIVFHLGDMFLCNAPRAMSICARLNGTIHYINGNHESATKNEHLRDLCFDSVQDYLRIKVRDTDLDNVPKSGGYQDIILFHYPIASWEKKSYGSWNLTGHTHSAYNKYNENISRLDVGVDSVAGMLYKNKEDYTPISYEFIKNQFKNVLLCGVKCGGN